MTQEIIFTPTPSSCQKPSISYAAKMGLTTLWGSISFLWDASFHQASISLADKHIKNFARNLLQTSHTTLEVVGRDKIDFNRSYVYMSNHPSLLDIPVLFEAIPQSLRMVAKAELFRIPIFGQALERTGFIRIDRGNREKAIIQLETAKERLKEGISVWISLEGTRSRSTEMKPFKKGGFHIAMSLGVPIVPIWIEGTAQVIPPDSLKVCPNRQVTLFFGTPIETTEITKESLEKLVEQVRHAILALKS